MYTFASDLPKHHKLHYGQPSQLLGVLPAPNCFACQPPHAEIPGYFFNEAGELQGRAMSGLKPKLFVPQQPTLAYFI
jgi:hypothetical protein